MWAVRPINPTPVRVVGFLSGFFVVATVVLATATVLTVMVAGPLPAERSGRGRNAHG